MADAVLERVLGNEASEGVRQLPGHCGRAPRTGMVGEAREPVGRQVMDPLAQRGIGKVQGVRDGLEVLSYHHCTHGLGTPAHTHLLRLLEEAIEAGQGVSGKGEFARPHGEGLQGKL